MNNMTAIAGLEQRPYWLLVLFYGFFLTDSMNWLGVFFGLDFRLGYLLVGLGITFMCLSGNLVIPKRFIWFLLCVAVWSVLAGRGRADILAATLIQLTGILPFAIVAYIITTGLSLHQASTAYLGAAKIVAYSILFEQSIFLVGGYGAVNLLFFPLGGVSESYVVDGVLRAAGILYEPSQVGLLLPPALYMATRLKDWRSVAWVCMGIFGSFSGLGFVGTVIAVLMANVSIRKFLQGLPLLLLLFSMFFISPAVQDRVNNVTVVLAQDDIRESDSNQLNSMGGSVGGLVVNFLVLQVGLSDAPLAGHGLGSFAVMFNEYLKIAFEDGGDLSVLYPGQGKSLLIRLLFEFGVVGVALFLFYFYKKWAKIYKNKDSIVDGELRLTWAITSMIFFLIYMIRKDTYVSFYIWFFFFIFVAATKYKTRPVSTGK